MAKLKDRMRSVATKLISEYGNSCTLSKQTITGRTYNPTTDEYEGVVSNVSIETKCTYRELTLTEIQDGGSDAVKRVATVYYDDRYNELDTQWKIDGLSIIKVSKKDIQDGTVIYTLFVG